MFPFIKIENKNYPTLIMGEDHFTGWFSKTKNIFLTEKDRANNYKNTLNISYKLGVRGFSMSPHKTLIEVLNNFKKEHSDIVCIANPHYYQNYYLNGESLWTPNNLNRLSGINPFSNQEISQFYLDEQEYTNNLNIFNQFCDFSLIGNLYQSSLMLLGRQDLLIKESKLVRKSKMIPLIICEAGFPAFKRSQNIDCGGYWIRMSQKSGIPNELIEYLKTIDKPITAYKAFTRSDGFNPQKSVEFFKTIPQVKSLTIGIENALQAQETFTLLNKI